MSTFLDLTDMALPRGNQAISWVPAMEGEPGRKQPSMRGVNHCIIRTTGAKNVIDQNGEELLFDYATDPHELCNVVGAGILGRRSP